MVSGESRVGPERAESLGPDLAEGKRMRWARTSTEQLCTPVVALLSAESLPVDGQKQPAAARTLPTGSRNPNMFEFLGSKHWAVKLWKQSL